MIGLALVTFVATLGAGPAQLDRDALERRRSTPTTSSPSNERRSTRSRRRPATPIADARPASTRVSACATTRRASSARAPASTGVDPATIGSVYRFDWQRGSDATLAGSARTARSSARSFADRPRTSRSAARSPSQTPSGEAARSRRRRGIYDRRRRSTRCSARSCIIAGGVRPRLPAAAERLHVRDRQGGGDRGAAALEAALAAFPDAKLARAPPGSTTQRQRHRQAPEPALRAARAVGDREPVRHGQHARARRSSSARASSGCCARSA